LARWAAASHSQPARAPPRWAPNQATLWSQDSQRIIATTLTLQGGQQASVLARDGALRNTGPLPSGYVFGLTGDDQLILDVGDGNGVRWLPLLPKATPYAPDVIQAGGGIAAIYLPASGNSTAHP